MAAGHAGHGPAGGCFFSQTTNRRQLEDRQNGRHAIPAFKYRQAAVAVDGRSAVFGIVLQPGKAKAVKDNVELATRVAQERLFVALYPDQVQVQALTPELRIRLQLEATSGAYSLYSSILNWL